MHEKPEISSHEAIFAEYEELLKYLKGKIDELKEIFGEEIVAREI